MGLPWLVLSAHGSAAGHVFALGVILACYGVPRMVLIPLGGVLADKIGPRTLMLCADMGRCAVVVALAVLATRHVSALAALGPIAALVGAGEGLFLPASFAIMPSLLSEEQLTAGNALSSALTQTGALIGPGVGGASVALTGTSIGAFAVDAASFAISALTLSLIPRRPAAGSMAAASAPEPDAGAEAAGDAATEDSVSVLAYLRGSRAMQVMLLVVVAANLGVAGSAVALPALAHQSWGAAGYGVLLACEAAGALLGALAGTRAGGVRAPAILSASVFVLAAAAMSLVRHLAGEPGAAAALLVLGGCAWPGQRGAGHRRSEARSRRDPRACDGRVDAVPTPRHNGRDGDGPAKLLKQAVSLTARHITTGSCPALTDTGWPAEQQTLNLRPGAGSPMAIQLIITSRCWRGR